MSGTPWVRRENGIHERHQCRERPQQREAGGKGMDQRHSVEKEDRHDNP